MNLDVKSKSCKGWWENDKFISTGIDDEYSSSIWFNLGGDRRTYRCYGHSN
ncbi:MAG: hypothetical protein MUO60_14680 [Clostridiaceae bacterium]|nr:hypothetical protein [Clostridiaceae bacterium]